MNQYKYRFFLGAAAVLFGLGGISSRAIAASESAPVLIAKQAQSSTFRLPRPLIDPENLTLVKKNRFRCGKLNHQQLTLFRPLLPLDDSMHTMAAKPSLWVYLPTELAVGAEVAVWLPEDGELIYEQWITEKELGEKVGLLELQLPENLLQPNVDYAWSFSLNMRRQDPSGDIFVLGELHWQDPTQLTLVQDPATLDLLGELLAADDNVLSLDLVTAKSLAYLLNYQRNPEAIAQVETQLREHLLAVHQAYETAQLEPTTSQLQEQRILELAQLSAFFGLWADTAHFLASIRNEYPDIWQAALPTLLDQDIQTSLDPETRDLMNYRLETLQNMPQKITSVHPTRLNKC